VLALEKRLEDIKKRITQAALKAGREPEEIELIAVSKNHPVSRINFFKEQGIRTFGESRVQELQDKYEKVSDINWHFIGHLQRNKVKYLVRMKNCTLIHSLDSLRLAREINKRARKNNRIMPVLIEVNIAEDENKFGFLPGEVEEFLREAKGLQNIDIQGLMTIVPYVDDPEEVRPYFQKMAALKDSLNNTGYQLKELSMGMTNDFEVAIEEGATMIRIGTGLFGERED
jgi:hypothetical protein